MIVYPYWVLGLNFLGAKAIVGYIVIIVIVVAVAMYMRRGTTR